MKTKVLAGIVIGIVFVSVMYFVSIFAPTQRAEGSVNLANEYQGTTTTALNAWTIYQLTQASGALGSIVITKAGGANEYIYFYDATTSNIALRNNIATSSLRFLGGVEASQAAGTYTYDVAVRYGLLMVKSATLTGTSTITFR